MRTLVRRGSVLLAAVILGAAVAFPLAVVANHQFSDVPTADPFHGDIDAIADAGVTAGCGGGKYCPDAFVTREQMAAFLNRLGALGAGKAPVVNAAKLNGLTASSLVRVDGASQVDTIQLEDFPSFTSYLPIDFNTPLDGFALVTASVTVLNNGCTTACWAFGRIRHTDASINSVLQQVSVPDASFATMTITHVFAVAEGFNTFEVQLAANAEVGAISGFWAQVTVQFSHFGEATTIHVPTKDSTKTGPSN
jgi:hypothetical protein